MLLINNIDIDVLIFTQQLHNIFLDELFWQISKSYIFIPLWLWALYVIIKTYPLKNFLWIVLALGLGITASDQCSNLFKYQVKRLRPTHEATLKQDIHLVHQYEGGKYGFYSAHASNSALIAFMAIILLKKNRWKYIFVLYSLLIGFSRIYIAAHYFTDVLFGWLMGIAIAFIIWRLFKSKITS